MNWEEIKNLVEKIVEYTRNWSISETEWYYNVNDTRKADKPGERYISSEEFERAIREDILYCLFYNIRSIKQQMENDYEVGYDTESFDKANRDLEAEIQKFNKDFKIER